ncbi:MAG: hypothetical protein AB7H93_13975 [Vicinamibacterales bacterium]
MPLAWREVSALLVEAIRQAHSNGGTLGAGVEPASCFVTRGGEIVLAGRAAAARPEAVLELVGPLTAACVDPGDLGQAAANSAVVPFLEAFAADTPWRRRRVQIAAIALRAIAAETDLARTEGAQTSDAGAAAMSAAGAATRPAVAPAGGEPTPPPSATDAPSLRRFTRQSPRGGDDAGPREPRHYRLKVVVSARRRPLSVVGARLAIWTAIAVSATAAGFGAWRVAAQATAAGRRPPIARPDRVVSDPGSPAPAVLRTSDDASPTER